MSTFMINRRRLLAGSAGLGTLAVLGAPASTAVASHYEDYDTVAAYEQGWAEVDTSVGNNEAGGLGWLTSYLMLSLVRMYQATGDTSHLDRFVDIADQVWDQTDRRRGVTDHAGRSGWVWRAGNAYTAAGATIADADGGELFEVRWAGSDPDNGTVTVSNVTATGFDLALTHAGADTVTVAGVNLDPDSADHVVARVNAEAYRPNRRWTAQALTDDPTAPPAAGTTALAGRFFVFAVHTGMVTYPMALFARVVLEQQLPRYRGAAQRYLARTRKAVAFHDPEWRARTLADGSEGGDYVWPVGSPIPFDGLVQPFNQTQGLGQTMAELHRITRRPEYAARVDAMVASFRSDMEVVDGVWQWHYWPTWSEVYTGYTEGTATSTYTPWYGGVIVRGPQPCRDQRGVHGGRPPCRTGRNGLRRRQPCHHLHRERRHRPHSCHGPGQR